MRHLQNGRWKCEIHLQYTWFLEPPVCGDRPLSPVLTSLPLPMDPTSCPQNVLSAWHRIHIHDKKNTSEIGKRTYLQLQACHFLTDTQYAANGLLLPSDFVYCSLHFLRDRESCRPGAGGSSWEEIRSVGSYICAKREETEDPERS